MCPRECPSLTDEKTRLRKLRASLKRASENLKAFEVRLLVLHQDHSGTARLVYAVPLIPGEHLHIARSIRSRESAAAAGCELSAAWLEETKERRARIEALRMTKPQERAADYNGPSVTPTAIMRAGKKLSPEFLRSSEDAAELAANYRTFIARYHAQIEARTAERLAHVAKSRAERKARAYALREEFLAEFPHLRPD